MLACVQMCVCVWLAVGVFTLSAVQFRKFRGFSSSYALYSKFRSSSDVISRPCAAVDINCSTVGGIRMASVKMQALLCCCVGLGAVALSTASNP